MENMFNGFTVAMHSSSLFVQKLIHVNVDSAVINF